MIWGVVNGYAVAIVAVGALCGLAYALVRRAEEHDRDR